MASLSDNFNRANSGTSVGTDWTNRQNTCGINTNSFQIPSAGWASASHNTALSTDDMCVYGPTPVAQPSGEYLTLWLGCPTSGQCPFLAWGGDATFAIYTDTTAWSVVSPTSRASGTPGFGPRIDDTLAFQRRGTNYSGYINRVKFARWIDSGVVQTIGSSNRLVGAGGNASSIVRKWDSWDAQDITSTDRPIGPTVEGFATATVTASRSPSVTFSNYTPELNDVVCLWAASTAAAAAATAPSGWLLPTPASGANPVASDSHTQAFTYHLVTAGEVSGATTTYTATNLWNAVQTGNVIGCVVRGIDPAGVVDSMVSTFDSGNTVTPHVLAGLTGTNLSTSSIVISAVAKDGTGTYTMPTGWTTVTTYNTNQGQWLGVNNTLTTASTNVAATNITPSGGDEYCSITVALTATAPPAPPPNDGTASGTYTWRGVGGYETEMDFTTKSVGAMPSTADTGQTLVSSWNAANAVPVISNPGSGARHTIASTDSAVRAGYLTTDLDGPVTRIDATWQYLSSGAGQAAWFGMQAWAEPFPSGTIAGFDAESNSHISFGAASWRFGLWIKASQTEDVLHTRNYSAAYTDTTARPVSVVIDRANGKAYVTGWDGVQVEITDSRIGTIPGNAPGVEIWMAAANSDRRIAVLDFTATSRAAGAVESSGAVGEAPPDTNNGTASASYTWVGTSAGTRVSRGTGSGTYTWAGTSAGKRVPKATGSGTYTWAGTSAGKRVPKATGSGTYTWAGTSAGSRTSRGTGSGAYTWAGTSAGKRTPKATGSGTYAWAGTAAGARASRGTGSGAYTWATTSATGTAPVVGQKQGAASGLYMWAGTAAGSRTSRGTGSGNYTWVGTAAGDTPPNSGTASGTYTWAGSAAGKRVPKATGSGTYTWAGASAGRRVPKATGSGTYTWATTSVTGNAPTVGVNEGAATGIYSWAGVSAGARISRGTGSGNYTWVGTAAGAKTSRGTSSGSYTWAATAAGARTSRGTGNGAYTWATTSATGSAPTVGSSQGAATGIYMWAGTSAGARVSRGTSSGTYTWAGTSAGKRIPKATGLGTYTWAGTTAGKRVPKATGSGVYTWAGTAGGVAPAVGVNDGNAAGTYTWSSTRAGSRASRGTGGGTYTWAGTAVGGIAKTGASSGIYMWAGSSTGKRVPKAAAAGTYTWAGTAAGAIQVRGTGGGAYQWAGASIGSIFRSGTATGDYQWAGAAFGFLPGNSHAAGDYGWVSTVAGRIRIAGDHPRLTLVPAENRYTSIPAEPRLTLIPAESRYTRIPSESRYTSIP